MPRRRRGLRLDRFDLGLGLLFAALSVWVLALDLFQVIAHGRVWTGTDGFFVIDQMQYLAWIRDASHHLLAANLFVLHHTPADYLQPAVLISGVLAALGVAPWLALLMWKPVAVAVTFVGARWYVRRTLSGRWARRAALSLALFYGSFSIVYGSFSVIGDLFPGFLSWGYTFGLLSLGAMVLALVVYDRRRAAERIAVAPALLGCLASSLHPWQGELLIALIVGVEAWRWRDPDQPRPRLATTLLTIGLTALPLLYYAILDRADPSWGLARDASKHAFSFWSIALALAPLVLPALLGYRGRARGFLDCVTRLWPPAALLVYGFSATGLSATPLHAFEGITIPLGVLAVAGVRGAVTDLARAHRRRALAARLLPVARRLRAAPVAGAVAVALVTIPATVWELGIAHQFMAPTPGNANFITRDERAALDYLDHDADDGGVLTRFYLGAVVPARTGRRTYVGNCLWSEPGCIARAQQAQQLLDGKLTPVQAQQFVLSTRARFVLTDCAEPTDLTTVLQPLLVAVHRFGCASVYELSPVSAQLSPAAADAMLGAVTMQL